MLRKRPLILRRHECAPTKRRVCAWCGCDQGPMGYRSATASYGICDACVRRNFGYLYEPEASKAGEGEAPLLSREAAR